MSTHPDDARGWQAPHGVPVSILTGFLGAGKTTLLNRLIGEPWLSDAALIINEFGDVGIDHLLVENSGDGVIELSDGCLCCTVRGELVDTLADLMDRMQTGKIRPFSRLVIETTGLADPVPVMQSVIGHPALGQSYRLEGLVTVVDAVNGLPTLDAHEEARRQVAVADTLVVSKCEDKDPPAELSARLAALNPLARRVMAKDDSLTAQRLFDSGAYDPGRKSMDVLRWFNDGQQNGHGENHSGPHHHDHDHDHEHEHEHEHEHGHDHAHGHHDEHGHDINRHDELIRADTLVTAQAIEPQALEMFLDLLRSAHGPSLLRMKAIVRLADDPARPLVLHAVQSLMSEPVRLAAWPDRSDGKTRIVVITRDMPEGFIGELFAGFSGEPGIDRPDRAALTENPLAIPGAPAGWSAR